MRVKYRRAPDLEIKFAVRVLGYIALNSSRQGVPTKEYQMAERLVFSVPDKGIRSPIANPKTTLLNMHGDGMKVYGIGSIKKGALRVIANN